MTPRVPTRTNRWRVGIRAVFQIRTSSACAGAFLTLAVISVAALPATTTTRAYFTDQQTTVGNTVSSATLSPVSTLTAATAGPGSNVSWSSASALPWAISNNVSTGANYTLKRTTGTNTKTVYTGAGTATSDPGNPALRSPTVEAGTSYNCAINPVGAAYCWGANSSGQLGNGSDVRTSSPVAVSTAGVLAGKALTAIATGTNHTCALDSTGSAYCWGSNTSGQLGNGADAAATTPVAVTATGVLSGKTLTAIGVGQNHTCALDSAGTAYCWGGNSPFRQLGDGTIVNKSTTPVIVTGAVTGKALTALSVGTSHTCALDGSGTAYCWGGNSPFGQLGAGTALQSDPIAVTTTGALSGKTLTSISAGNAHTCALDTAGVAYCWGRNTAGQLGDGTTTPSATPVPVVTDGVLAGRTLAAIDAGGLSTCVLDSTGAAYCWGLNTSGQLGDGTIDNKTTPTAVDPAGTPAGQALTIITVGQTHTCATNRTGSSYCWGDNKAGQLGDNSTTDHLTPAPVGLLYFSQLAAGPYSEAPCALTVAGAAYCWGAGEDGQIGDGTGTPKSTPTSVNTSGVLSGKTLTAIASAAFNTCALDTAGAAYCWGRNAIGQLGNGTGINTKSPVAVTTTGVLAGKTLAAISSGYDHTCALDTAGAAYCWGANGRGQLGDGTYGVRFTPVAVTATGVLAGKTLIAIASGGLHTCAIDIEGAAYCWGRNTSGQLGDSGTTATDTPVAIAVTATGVLAGKALTAIAAGANSTCALDAMGAAYCWGANDNGQLGDGSGIEKNSPVAVTTAGVLTGKTITAIASGGSHTCAADNTGSTYCWGLNSFGQLGDGTNTNQSAPVAITSTGVMAGKAITTITTSSANSCALDTAGALYCWGNGGLGKLGDGTNANKDTPVAVRGTRLPVKRMLYCPDASTPVGIYCALTGAVYTLSYTYELWSSGIATAARG